MIFIYLEKDLERAIERYIHHREIVGHSRDDAKEIALADTREALKGKKALAESNLVPDDEQTRLIDASKKVTDKLPKRIQ